MATKMVKKFRRTVSFPNPPPPEGSSPAHRESIHVRSSSLTCRFCPILSRLRGEIADLRSWETGCRTSTWICDGLSRLKAVHETLDYILHLPKTRDALRGAYAGVTEKLLEDLLLFIDVYGKFQALIQSMKEEQSAAQIAVRRKDDAKAASCWKNLNKIVKEIRRLNSNFSSIEKSASTAAGSADSNAVELIDAINDVIRVTASTSATIFARISNSWAFRSQPSILLNLMTKSKQEEGIWDFQGVNLENPSKKTLQEVTMASKKMQEMEDLMEKIESCSDRAFRSLIKSRVSLLNVLTQ